MRWFAAVLAALTLGLVGCGADDDTSSDAGTTGTEATDTTSEVDQGVGSQDASEDVVLDTVVPGEFGFATPKLTVTNNSSKRSDYYVEANVVNQPDDAVIGYTNALVSNLEPGAVAKVDMVDVEWESTYKVVITEVQRTAS